LEDGRSVAFTILKLAVTAQRSGRLDLAAERAQRCDAMFALLDDRVGKARVSELLGELAHSKANWVAAASWLRNASNAFKIAGKYDDAQRCARRAADAERYVTTDP